MRSKSYRKQLFVGESFVGKLMRGRAFIETIHRRNLILGRKLTMRESFVGKVDLGESFIGNSFVRGMICRGIICRAIMYGESFGQLFIEK